jgi:hypothetical protein
MIRHQNHHHQHELSNKSVFQWVMTTVLIDYYTKIIIPQFVKELIVYVSQRRPAALNIRSHGYELAGMVSNANAI